ncbi:hypothetical protein JCM8547_005027 [Rhodosporidiobolus lusitaniae]
MRLLAIWLVLCAASAAADATVASPDSLVPSSPLPSNKHSSPPLPTQHLDRRQACSISSECTNAVPANSNRFCNKGTCSWRCRSGFVQSGSACRASSTSSTPTSTTSRSSSTTSSRTTNTSAAPTAATCSMSSQCTNTPPANANRYCSSGMCSWRCRSGYTRSGSSCLSTATTSSSKTTSSSTRTFSFSSSRTTTIGVSSSSCATRYTGAATTISGTGTLPKPTAFVTRSGQQLKLGGKYYRIVGPNIYWLCSDENAAPWAAPPDKGRVREAMAIAVAMGSNTIRIHTCGISVGPQNPYTFEPSLGVFSEEVARHRDYVLYAAGEYGLRVILPLTDNYQYYHGGKYSFIDFYGLSHSNGGSKFFLSSPVVRAFGAYITAIVSRVNTYTGVTYGNDPTILGWETGNEFGGYINAEMWPPASWTNQVINYIRAAGGKQLIIDGSGGFWNYTTGATAEGLTVPGVDIMSDHGYPRNTGILNKEIQLAKSAGKGFFIGEYDWTAAGGGVSLDSYLSTIESSGSYLGDMIWNVMGHDAQCCNFVPHNDGYSLYYPNGNSAADQANILKVVQHFYRVTGRAIPSKLPAVACPQPELPKE